ncbi:MAG: VCBS repeat-containing protein [Planctomycetota bacterium]|nr:VCBS repeat-containing protein [Planctomycetota bacterium]
MYRVPLILSLVLGCASCSGEGTESEYIAHGDEAGSIEIAVPDNPITQLEAVEDATEEVADRLLSYSDKVRRRDWEAAAAWFSEDFKGEGLAGLQVTDTTTEHMGVEISNHDAEASPVLDKAGFLENLAELLADWTRVKSAIWKVKAAEFQRGRGQRWGRIKLYVHVTGVQTNGGGIGLAAWCYAKVVQEGGEWKFSALDLDSFTTTKRDSAIFTPVAAAAGIAHSAPRFGSKENNSFAFNGAACGDVNGDGRWDLFLPSDGRNFLYLAQADGSFVETAEQAGLATPDGGTGAVFFDYDNDGDQDLAVGHVDDEVGGTRLCLYTGDGKGHFKREELGLGIGIQSMATYSLTVLDYDGDGWLDLYACGYGVLAKEHNNSWIEATNGSPNALFRNIRGKSFVDVAEELGVRGNSWSYASAAIDIDDDGDQDLYVANDYGTNRLYVNQHPDGFEDRAAQYGITDQGNGMGASFGDFTGNGSLDLYVSNMSSTAGNRILDRYQGDVPDEIYASLKKAAAGNTIFARTSAGSFEKVPKAAGGVGANWAWSPALADFDLDGRLDVFCTNGFVTGELPFDT